MFISKNGCKDNQNFSNLKAHNGIFNIFYCLRAKKGIATRLLFCLFCTFAVDKKKM